MKLIARLPHNKYQIHHKVKSYSWSKAVMAKSLISYIETIILSYGAFTIIIHNTTNLSCEIHYQHDWHLLPFCYILHERGILVHEMFNEIVRWHKYAFLRYLITTSTSPCLLTSNPIPNGVQFAVTKTLYKCFQCTYEIRQSFYSE